MGILAVPLIPLGVFYQINYLIKRQSCHQLICSGYLLMVTLAFNELKQCSVCTSNYMTGAQVVQENCKVIILQPTIRSDKWKSGTDDQSCDLLGKLNADTTNNKNIVSNHLGGNQCTKNEVFDYGFLQETADLVTCTEEMRNGKRHFLCSESTVS